MSDSLKLLEVIRLTSDVIDGALRGDTIGDADLSRLDQLLVDDEAAQQFYLRQLAIDSCLAWRGEHAGDRMALSFAQTNHVDRGVGSRRRWMALAASVVLVASVFYGAFALVAWNLRPNPAALAKNESPATEAAANDATSQIATLSATENCRWGYGGESLHAGTRLSPGFTGDLASGRIEIRLDDGSQVELTGPCKFELRSRKEVYLQAGVLAAKVPRRAIGFTVVTPAATIVDLGTEFGVETGVDGATEVHVLRGAVEARSREVDAPVLTLRANQAIRFASTGSDASTIEFEPQRFARELSGKRAPAAAERSVLLPLAEILPGSEYVTLVANGDFEDRGAEEPAGSKQFPKPEVWQRFGHMFVNPLPQGITAPSICGQSIAFAALGANQSTGFYAQKITLEADTEYVLSAYLWNWSHGDFRAKANIDLGDAPGEPVLELRPDNAKLVNGCFCYDKFNTTKTGQNVLLRVFFDDFQTTATGAQHGVAWDRIALTKANRFLPPRLRDRDRPQPGAANQATSNSN